MQKVSYILVIIVLCGCSVLKRGADKDLSQSDNDLKTDLKTVVLKQNLSDSGFYITKAEIAVTSEGESQKFIASIKFLVPGNYLISLRSKTGIEAVRAYITNDTILVNDRINRNLYKGRADYVQRKYGIPVKLLPLIFGDLIFKSSSDILEECIDGFCSYEYLGNGVRYSYVVDCKKGKVIRVENISELSRETVRLSFSKFIKSDSKLIPTNIRLSYSGNEILIRILKLASPWDGNIEFIPGNNYELIDL